MALMLYFGVMTMWLVELISVAKVYLRLLVLSARDGDVQPPPPFQKGQRRCLSMLRRFSFGLLRVVGKTALLRGVCVDKCHVGMPLPSLTILPFPLRPPKKNLVCVCVCVLGTPCAWGLLTPVRTGYCVTLWVPHAHGVF